MTVRQLDRPQLRRLARAADFHPCSSSGQHFLHDAEAARRIVAASDTRRHDHVLEVHVLEVGAGMGLLTLALLGRGAHVTGVEVDPALARQLPATVADHTHSEIHRLTVLNRDVLSLYPPDLAYQPRTAILKCRRRHRRDRDTAPAG